MPISIYCAASVAKVINVLNYMYVGYLTCCVLYELTVNSYSTSMYLVVADGTEPFRPRANSLPGANPSIGPWPIRSLALLLPVNSLPGHFLGANGPGSEKAVNRC